MHISLAQVYAMPASEFTAWQAYFDIYPFTAERLDQWAAMLASMIYNTAGKTFKKPIDASVFLPNYLREDKPAAVVKSIEQQNREWKVWKDKYKSTLAAQGKKL